MQERDAVLQLLGGRALVSRRPVNPRRHRSGSLVAGLLLGLVAAIWTLLTANGTRTPSGSTMPEAPSPEPARAGVRAEVDDRQPVEHVRPSAPAARSRARRPAAFMGALIALGASAGAWAYFTSSRTATGNG